MKRTQYTAEFKAEAVKQIIEKGHPESINQLTSINYKFWILSKYDLC